MKTLLLAVAMSAGLAGAVSAEVHGAWTAARGNDKDDRGRVYMHITRGMWQNSLYTMKLADYTGITLEQIDSPTQVPVLFRLAREAGTITFEGSFRHGDGAGQFSFEPNRGYIDSLRATGVAFELKRHSKKNQTEEELLFTLAQFDVSTAFIRSMQAEGYRETLDMYFQMRLHGVTPDFVRQLKEEGYSNLPAKKLVALKIHGVDINFIRQMNSIE